MKECKLEEAPVALEPPRFPDSVLYVDKTGVLVTKEEVLDKGRVRKITGRLPYSPYEDKAWTQEEINKLPEHVYYVSGVDGGYIGDDFMYNFLVNKKKLILIQKTKKEHNTCSIGYSPRENKWYGWSHRAIHGFTIGDEVEEGDLTNTSGFIEEYRIQHPDEDMSLPVGFKALTLNDAKRMAIAFAEAVS